MTPDRLRSHLLAILADLGADAAASHRSTVDEIVTAYTAAYAAHEDTAAREGLADVIRASTAMLATAIEVIRRAETALADGPIPSVARAAKIGAAAAAIIGPVVAAIVTAAMWALSGAPPGSIGVPP